MEPLLPHRVLVVEDNPGDLRLLQETLRQSASGDQFEITPAELLSKALEALAKASFNLILLDLGLPDSSGVDTFLKIHSMFPSTAVIVLTGLDDRSSALKVVKEGAQDYIVKGNLDAEVLSRSMRHAIARKKAEDAARESEERFRIVVESAPNGIVLTDNKGMISLVNSQTERMFGYARKELIGQSVELLVPMAARAKHAHHRMEYDPKAHSRPLGMGRDLHGLRKDGKEFPIEIGLSSIATGGGILTLSTIVDISERKKMEDSLRESAARYQLLFDANPLPAWVSDRASMKFLAVNNAAVEHYGYSREEFLSMTTKQIRPSEEFDRFDIMFERHYKGLAVDRDWKHKLKNGVVIDVQVIFHDLVFEGKEAVMVIAIDVSERRRAEREIEEAHRELKNVFDSVDQVIFSLDTVRGRLHHISPATLKIYGRPPEDFLENPNLWMEMIHPEDIDRVRAEQRLIEQGQTLVREFRIIRADGAIRYVIATVKPTMDASGKVIRIDGIVSDQTDHKALEMQLMRSQRLESIGTLAGGIA
ncbi:MAG TPA: PAS domain S-box protein, partial [Bacteroidota bacterium]|nr:PAS domain S-box protein [Bacteroidota bacterium]